MTPQPTAEDSEMVEKIRFHCSIKGHHDSPCADCLCLALATTRQAAERKAEALDFWKDIVVKDGVLDIEAVKVELEDYKFILSQYCVVLDHATGGLLSKQNYYAKDVIAAIDDHYDRVAQEAIEEAVRAAEEGQRSRIEEIIKDEIEHIKIMLEGAKGHILSGWMGSAETAETLLAAIRATGVGSKP